MNENCVQFTSDNFDELLASNSLVLVDFWANWCGPCKMLGPIIEEVANDFAGKALVGKVNVDESLDLAERFGISSIPAVYIFKDGHVVEKMIGFRQKAQVTTALNNHIE